MNIAELVAAINRDLADVDSEIRWAHTDAYSPHAPDPDRPSRRAPVDDQQPDTVPGARHDIGIGDHRSRAAYQRAVHQLHQAETYLVLAVALAGQPQPRRRLTTHPTHADVLDAIRLASRRAATIADYDGPHRTQVRRALTAARHRTDAAWRTLTAAFQRGTVDPDTQAVGEPPCRVCGVRPRAPKAGGRCNTCATWKARNGFERPRHLDGHDEARAAAQRRRNRGQGYGEA